MQASAVVGQIGFFLFAIACDDWQSSQEGFTVFDVVQIKWEFDLHTARGCSLASFEGFGRCCDGCFVGCGCGHCRILLARCVRSPRIVLILFETFEPDRRGSGAGDHLDGA